MKRESKTDYTSGGDFPLTVYRDYSSDRVDASVDFEGHWQFMFSGKNVRKLFFQESGNSTVVTAVNSDRSTTTFNSNNGVTFSSDSDVTTRLEKLENGWRLTDNGDEIQEFDDTGRVVRVENKSGLSHSYQYGISSVSVSDSFGRILTINLGLYGSPSSVTLPDSTLIKYSYDSSRMLSEVSYADGSKTRYVYEDDRGQLTGIVNELGIRYATFGYDESDRANLGLPPVW